MTGPKAWSATAVQTWEKCPQQFFHRYVAKTPREKTATPMHWMRGTVVHGGLEAAYNHRKAQGGQGDMWTPEIWNAAKQGILAAWLKEGLPDPEGHLFGEKLTEWNLCHELVEKSLRDLVDSAENIVAAEYKLFVPGKPSIIGFIDLLRRPEPNVAHIRDYKTRSKASKPDELFRDFQGNLYGGLVMMLLPWAQKLRFSHYYPPIATEVTVDLDPRNAKAAVDRVFAAKDMVDAETEWEPVKGSWCSTCIYRDVCPAWAVTDPVAIAAADNDF